MKIVCDPGHGGRDPGAVNYLAGAQEKDINLQIATSLHGWLLSSGHMPLMTRDEDEFVSLAERAAIANREDADAFISIHCNAAANPSAKGFEIWTSPGQTRADALATAIGDVVQSNIPNLVSRFDYTDGDLDKEGNLAVLRLTKCPAVLIEAGFISDPYEAEWLLRPETIQKIAMSISIGVSMWANG